MEALVDGRNRLAAAGTLLKTYRQAHASYEAAGVPQRLRIQADRATDQDVARWLLDQLQR
jgi:hypothetical protein